MPGPPLHNTPDRCHFLCMDLSLAVHGHHCPSCSASSVSFLHLDSHQCRTTTVDDVQAEGACVSTRTCTTAARCACRCWAPGAGTAARAGTPTSPPCCRRAPLHQETIHMEIFNSFAYSTLQARALCPCLPGHRDLSGRAGWPQSVL